MTTVLLVDDSATDRMLARMCAEQLNLKVVHAENGREAVDILEGGGIDVVLTDLQMPEMNGLELVEHVVRRHAKVPVILMTSHGSEEVAVAALRAGAASYVPKKNLNKGLLDALENVLASVQSDRQRELIRGLLADSRSQFLLGYTPGETQTLVSYLQEGLTRLNLFDDSGLLQIGTALTEALNNAIDHGNLELDSELRDSEDLNAYRELGNTRAQQAPYRDRRVHVTATLTPETASYVIRDEGPGFDVHALPDPTDPENLIKPFGRGVMLIRTFMDEVEFNEQGNEISLIKRRKQ